MIDDLLPVLEQLHDATEILSTERYPSASCILPLLHHLLDAALVANDVDSVLVQNFKTKVTKGLKNHFKCPNDVDFSKSLPDIASFLDPRHKTLKFNVSAQIQEEIKQQIMLLTQNENGEQLIKREEPPIKKEKKAVLRCLDGDFSEINDEEGIEAEIERYIAEPVQIRNPLMWWKHYEKKFPNLSKLARKVLCVMGTSVPSERAFSQAGLTVTKTRAKLSPDVVDEFIFLNKSLKNDPDLSVPAFKKIKVEQGMDIRTEPELEVDENEDEDEEPPLPNLY